MSQPSLPNSPSGRGETDEPLVGEAEGGQHSWWADAKKAISRQRGGRGMSLQPLSRPPQKSALGEGIGTGLGAPIQNKPCFAPPLRPWRLKFKRKERRERKVFRKEPD